MPWKNEKKLHTHEFQLKCIGENMRCSFQIYLKFIKLVIPKIPFILVLYSFNFYFKIRLVICTGEDFCKVLKFSGYKIFARSKIYQ